MGGLFFLMLAASLWLSTAYATSDEFFPPDIRSSIGQSSCLLENAIKVESLISSTDMLARTGATFLDVPFDIFADYLMSPMLLPSWNTDYASGGTDEKLHVCGKFTNKFTTKINVTVPSGFSFKPPLILTVNRTSDVALFGWQFGVSDDAGNDFYYGAHWIGAFKQYVNGLPVVKYISWEKIGNSPFVRQNKAAFTFGMSKTVLQPDIAGAMCLEVYATYGVLEATQVASMCSKLCL